MHLQKNKKKIKNNNNNNIVPKKVEFWLTKFD